MSNIVLQFPNSRARAERWLTDALDNKGLSASYRELVITRLAKHIETIKAPFSVRAQLPPELSVLTEERRQAIVSDITTQVFTHLQERFSRALAAAVCSECITIEKARAAGLEVIVKD